MSTAICHDCDNSDNTENKYYRQLIKKTWFAALIAGIIFITTMFGLVPPLNDPAGYLINVLYAILSGVVLVYSGRHFFIGAHRAFLNHVATMDTLIAIGTGVAWIYSVIVLVFLDMIPPLAQHTYLEAATVIIALVDIGALLELRARRNTSQALELLMKLQPKTARVLRDNQEIDLDLKEIKIGDLIRVRPGEQIPVDGIIVEGTSDIDEAMLTGESLPRKKSSGDNVYTGTLNKSGSFVFRVTKIGAETALAQIVNIVQQAQNSKPEIAKLADRIAAFFVPTVLVIAILTALAWYNSSLETRYIYMLITSMSVLVIACPCALGLAVPISVMVGIGKAAQYGILIKHANVIQNICDVTAFVFDKTGTITLGQPRVIEVHSKTGVDKNTVLTLAASVETGSEHAYGAAILAAAQSQHLTITPANELFTIAGLGISGVVANQKISLGNKGFMQAKNIVVDELQNVANNCAQQAQTAIYVARDKELIGIIAIADPIKPNAVQVIKKLHDMNYKTIMITGDQTTTAQSIAKQAGIATVISEVMPATKAEQIAAIQQQGDVVAMVGDGINDAPALAQADVGIAMGSGSDIAIQTADVTLIQSNLNSIIDLIILSQAIMHNMRQNLFGAFVYNVLGIPIAAGVLFPFFGVLLNPMLAGLAMALSSFTVITNANRLRFLSKSKGI
jgi:Cu+-exporting ATPase